MNGHSISDTRQIVDASHDLLVSQFGCVSFVMQSKLNLARIRPSDLWPASLTHWLPWQDTKLPAARDHKVSMYALSRSNSRIRQFRETGAARDNCHKILRPVRDNQQPKSMSFALSTVNNQENTNFHIPDLNPTTQAGVEKQTKFSMTLNCV